MTISIRDSTDYQTTAEAIPNHIWNKSATFDGFMRQQWMRINENSKMFIVQ